MKKKRTIPAIVKRYDYPHGVPESKNGAMVLEAFTLHPPAEASIEDLKKVSGYITEFDFSKIFKGDTLEWISLLSKGGSFERTKNPVYLIEAFLIAHNNGLYPPMWVLNFIADVFKRYHDSLGELSLDKLFGCKRWKGQEPPFKTVLNEERDEMLMIDVWRLNLLGYSIDEASAMVAAKLENNKKWDKTGLKLSSLSEGTIQSIYKKKWSKLFKDEAFLKGAENFLKDNNKFKKEFLKTFPTYSFPVSKKTVV